MPNLREGFRQLLTTPIRFTPVVERGYRAIKVEGRIGLSEVFAGTLATNMASLMPASWNQIAGWLKYIDNLRQAA